MLAYAKKCVLSRYVNMERARQSRPTLLLLSVLGSQLRYEVAAGQGV